MKDDRDLYLRAMQPHQELLRQAGQESELRKLAHRQPSRSAAKRLAHALGSGLITAGSGLRAAGNGLGAAGMRLRATDRADEPGRS